MRGVVPKNHDTSWAGKDSPPLEGLHSRGECTRSAIGGVGFPSPEASWNQCFKNDNSPGASPGVPVSRECGGST